MDRIQERVEAEVAMAHVQRCLCEALDEDKNWKYRHCWLLSAIRGCERLAKYVKEDGERGETQDAV